MSNKGILTKIIYIFYLLLSLLFIDTFSALNNNRGFTKVSGGIETS